MAFHVLTDDWLFMMTPNIVPLDPVPVEVVEDSHTGLRLAVLLDLFPVIRLSAGRAEPSGSGPVVKARRAVGRTQSRLIGRPEPAIDIFWEEVRTVTTIEVTEPPRGPEIWHISIDEALNPVVLLSGLEGNQVHAPLPAIVSCVEPVPLGVFDIGVIVLPAEPIKMTTKLLNTPLVHSVSAQKSIGEAEFAGASVRVSAAVGGEEFLPPGGPRALGSVVTKASSASKEVSCSLEDLSDRPENVPQGVKELGLGGAMANT